MARRYYSSTAARTTLASGVDNSTTTLSVVAVSGWPSSYPYTLVIDQDTVNEELVSVTNRSGTTLTVTRGIDGTSAVAHDAGAAVNHGVSAQDFDEPNAFINGTGTVTETLLASNAVTSAKILDGTIVNADINASAAIAQSKIANLTSDLASKAANPKTVDTKTANYTLVLGDKDKIVQMNSTSASTITVPTNASVAFPVGTIVHVANINTGTLTIAGASGVTVSEAGGLTLAQWESGSLYQRAANAWVFLKGGGLGAANFSNAATGTYSSGGFNYKYITFTASGTLTVTKAGFADVLVVGGGGGGGYAGGGGGGHHLYKTNAYLEAGSLTVTVGAGGAGGTGLGGFGTRSSVSEFVAIGGGAGMYTNNVAGSRPGDGGSGGGAGAGLSPTKGFSLVGQGDGGTGNTSSGGGGGGGSATGTNATSNNGGAGGAGLSNSITGSSVARVGGGGGGGVSGGGSASDGGGAGTTNTGFAGTANTGGGGGGGWSTIGAAGGSGVVIVRVKV